MLHRLTVSSDNITNFCDFISTPGATIDYDNRFVDQLVAAHEASKALLSDKGLYSEIILRDCEPERLEIEDFDYQCYRHEFDYASVDHRGSISLWYVVGHDSNERFEVVVELDDLARAPSLAS